MQVDKKIENNASIAHSRKLADAQWGVAKLGRMQGDMTSQELCWRQNKNPKHRKSQPA